jgi:prevent-host-death family protein
MNDFDQILPISEVKRGLLPLIKKVQQLNESIAITRNGHPAAVLLSMEEYEGLPETIEILSNPKLIRFLRKSKKELVNIGAGGKLSSTIFSNHMHYLMVGNTFG